MSKHLNLVFSNSKLQTSFTVNTALFSVASVAHMVLSSFPTSNNMIFSNSKLQTSFTVNTALFSVASVAHMVLSSFPTSNNTSHIVPSPYTAAYSHPMTSNKFESKNTREHV